jgi:hypothetical protein
MTLRQLLDALENVEPTMPVIYDMGVSPGRFTTYRGDYTQLALGAGPDLTVVGELLERGVDVIGTQLEGYKGGMYTMRQDTPVWAAESHHVSSLAIVAAKVRYDTSGDPVVVLETLDISEYRP